MKIGILDSDNDYTNLLKTRLSEEKEWEATIVDSKNPHCFMFDVVLVGESIQEKNGLQIIKEHLNKCEAEFALLVKEITEEMIENDKLNAVVDRDDFEEIIEWLKYVDVKLRLKKNVEMDISLFKIRDVNIPEETDIPIIEINGLTAEKKSEMFRKIKEADYRCVLYFSKSLAHIFSTHLNQIVLFWKFTVNDNGGKIALWKAGRNGEIDSKFELCRLDALINTYDNLEEAIKHVKNI